MRPNCDSLVTPSRILAAGLSSRALAPCLLAWVFTGCSADVPAPLGPTGTGGAVASAGGSGGGNVAGSASAKGGSAPVGGTGGQPSNASGGANTAAGVGGMALTTTGGASSAGAPSTPSGGSGGSAQGGASQGGSAQAGAPQGGTAQGGGQAGSAQGGSAQGGSPQGGAAHKRDHCVDGYEPDPTDATMQSDGPVSFVKSNQTDTTVQPEVISWMQAHVWQEAHFQWHNIRRCRGGMVDRTRAGGLDPCTHTDLVPANQEGKGAGDGLEFFAMHRHMIQSLKQLWPRHATQFEGFEHFPTKASDLPPQWQGDWGSGFTGMNATNGAKADDPAAHMNEPGFESEGAFGQWIQTTSGIHGALHFKWVRSNNSEHGLGNQFTNIDNYMFWKMHGWIDKVWDRYRAAKGKSPTDQDIKDAVLAQCRQMDQLALLIKPDVVINPPSCTPAAKQTGTFVDTVRPIFEGASNKCTGCHGPSGANANLTLGGSDCVKSSDIVAALVNKPSTNGGQFKLVVPGDPDRSWLYLKAINKAVTAGCTPTGNVQCNTGIMPQGATSVTLTQAEHDALRKWIQDGAQAPQ